MTETELRPCPFCGKTPAYAKVIYGREKEIRITVHCANCSFNIGFFDGKEEALKAWNTRAEVEPQWISVKDRLPCEYGNYLAVVNGEVMECSYSIPNAGLNAGWSTCDAYGFKYIHETEITHWMPFPELPKEDETHAAD